MKLSKVISALGTAAALIAGSLVTSPVAATAAVAKPAGTYSINIANQSSTGDARDWVTSNGWTYFTVWTITYGRSIWGIQDTAGATPQLIADVAKDYVPGGPTKLSVVDDNLYFWDDATSAWDGYRPYVVNLTTKTVSEIKLSDDTSLSSNQYSSNFVESGGKIYFFSEFASDGDSRFLEIDPAVDTTKAVVANQLDFAPETYSNLHLVNGEIFISRAASGWNTNDGSVQRFDTVAKTFTAVVDGTSSVVNGLGISGVFTYKGAEVLIATKGSWQAGWDYYTVDTAGLATKFNHTSGSWAAGPFFNVGGDLFVRPVVGWGAPGELARVSEVDGAFTNVNAELFPDGSAIAYTTGVNAGGNHIFVATVGSSTKERIYKWDGATPAVQLGSVEPVAHPRFADYIYSGGFSRNESMGVIGDKIALNMAIDDSVGYEPYLVSPDGTVTLMKDFNTASEGSDPDIECTADVNGKIYSKASMPLQAGPQWGKDVLFEAWADGAYLRYNVIDPTDAVRNMCGFAGKGTDVYFSGNADNGDELFKMDAAGVVTRIGSLYASAIKAKIVGDKYYYWDDSDNNLWVYDLAADVETKLTGSNESLVEDGNIDELVFNGNKVYFTSDAKSDGYTHLWVVDLAKATYEEKMITPVANFTSDNYDKLVPNGTDVFFDYEGVNNEGRELYKISATDVVTKVDGFDAEGYGWLYGLTSNGTDILATYHVDSTNSQVVIRYAGGTTKSVLNFGADNKIECAAFAGNEVMASTQTGQALYYNSSTGAVQDAGFSFGNNNWAPCDAVLTSVGSFMYLSEYGYNGGPWDAEIGYVGTLIPWASKRLGVSVSEAPSAPAGYLPDANAVKPGAISGLTATAGSGVVNLSWTAPSVGTTPRYAVTSTPAGAYCVVTGTTAACTGTAGVSYTFTVVAANDAGVSAGVTSAAVKMPGAVVTPPQVDTDNPNLSALTETKTFKGTKGSVVFADGSGFDIDAKGRIFSKLKSKYLTSISGSIVATYVAGGKNKTFTCKLKTYGSVKKLKTLPRNAILYKSKQACQLPAAAITSLKAGKLTIVQKVLVKRYYATTAKDVDSKTKKKIKAMNRKMTVKFTK